MGITYIDAEATGPTGKKVPVRMLVDSGAAYSLLAEKEWMAIELQAVRKQAFSLADGTMIERDVSECRLLLPQGEATSPVILGQAGDEPLLGVVTLEIMGLVLNPFNRTLQPMRAILAQSRKINP